MKEVPNSGWATLFIFMACIVAVIALFSHSANATSVITISSSIITGAFGYIQGVHAANNSLQVPMNADSQSSTITVTPQAQNVPK